MTGEAGTGAQIQTLQEIRAKYLTLDAYQVSLAANAAHRLQRGRRAVAGAVACLLAGVILTWWAPASAASPPAYIDVAHDRQTTCGTLLGAGHGHLQLIPNGTKQLITVPFTHIDSLSLAASCS